MKLLTTVDIPKADKPITYEDKILCLGSCFAENISRQLESYYFRCTTNPFGTIYNPLSMLECLKAIRPYACGGKECFTEVDLVDYDHLYHSMLHSNDFSHSHPSETLAAINKSLVDGRKALEEGTVAILTLGTAYIYEMNGKVVSNCHKMPQKMFNRRRMSVDEVESAMTECLNILKDKHVIITISPIRHLKDGLHNNQISKATLQLGVEQAIVAAKEQGWQVDYFPSYCIMLDELRDYRFYDEDMMHPSEQAIKYIWERFIDTYMSETTQQSMTELHRLYLEMQHRPLKPDEPQYNHFVAQRTARYQQLKQRYSWI